MSEEKKNYEEVKKELLEELRDNIAQEISKRLAGEEEERKVITLNTRKTAVHLQKWGQTLWQVFLLDNELGVPVLSEPEVYKIAKQLFDSITDTPSKGPEIIEGDSCVK